jgi:hypothetical protein
MFWHKKIIAISVLFVKFAVASELSSFAQNEGTLCGEGEDVYFSCPLGNGKTVSICAKDNFSPNRGYVQYRYGIESNVFVYPEKNISPGKIFGISDVSEGSIRGLHLKFSSGAYAYVVSSVWPGRVYVSRDGKLIFDGECRASKYKSFSNKIFDGINQVPPSGVDSH